MQSIQARSASLNLGRRVRASNSPFGLSSSNKANARVDLYLLLHLRENMKNQLKLKMCAAAVALFANSAFAETIDFDSATPAGVTIGYITNTFNALSTLPTTVSNALAYTSSALPGGGRALLLQPYGALFTFSSAQSSISMVGNDFGGSNPTDNERVYLTVFDTYGSVLGSTSVQNAYSVPNLQPISFSAAGIKYAAFTFSNDLGYYSVDNVITTAVPEPESYAMLLAGLGLMGALARRRKQA